jgi:hypothetical protein
MGEGLLPELSWLDGSVSVVLPWRKVVLSLQFSAVRSTCRGKCFYLVSVSVQFLFSSGLIRLLDF